MSDRPEVGLQNRSRLLAKHPNVVINTHLLISIWRRFRLDDVLPPDILASMNATHRHRLGRCAWGRDFKGG